jgi:hypothetical protein
MVPSHTGIILKQLAILDATKAKAALDFASLTMVFAVLGRVLARRIALI